MGLSLPHLIILALVVLVLFGRGRISEMMGDFGKGIRSFKDGMSEDPRANPSVPPAPPAQIAAPGQTVSPVDANAQHSGQNAGQQTAQPTDPAQQ